MSGATSIEWAHATWNPERGCSPVSEGCRNCFAARQAARFGSGISVTDKADGTPLESPFAGFAKMTSAGPRWTGRVELIPEALDWPLRTKRPKWVRDAEAGGERPRVFVNSMSDLFHEKLSDEAIASVFAAMIAQPGWDFLVLTKRTERMLEWFSLGADLRSEFPYGAMAARIENLAKRWARYRGKPIPNGSLLKWPLPNLWLITSVEDQPSADARIPELLSCPAVVRGVSYEPALGPVDFTRFMPTPLYHCMGCGRELRKDFCLKCGTEDNTPTNAIVGIDWLIFGGESGPGARPCDITWARSARDQCREAGVAFYMKQLGAHPHESIGGRPKCRRRKTCVWFGDWSASLAISDPKGGDPSEWPEDLRVRQLPHQPAERVA